MYITRKIKIINDQNNSNLFLNISYYYLLVKHIIRDGKTSK